MDTQLEQISLEQITLAIGADHRGFAYKEFLKQSTLALGLQITWQDVGSFTTKRSDYPEFAHAVSLLVTSGKVSGGVLLCGSGVGMAMAANRHVGIYAAVVWNESVAAISKQHDNANVIVIPTDYVSESQVMQIFRAWITSKFFGERYEERLKMIDDSTQR